MLIVDKKPPAFPFLSKVETLTLFLRFASMAVFTVNTTLTTRKKTWETLEVFEVSEELLQEGCGCFTRTWRERGTEAYLSLCTKGKRTPSDKRFLPHREGGHTIFPNTPASSPRPAPTPTTNSLPLAAHPPETPRVLPEGH